MIERLWMGLAGLSGAVAMAIEALARHWAGADPHRVELAGTAARYALLHALALLAVCVLARQVRPRWAARFLHLAGWCFATGLVLFSGSLYWLAAGLSPLVAPLTPVGGTAFIAGWVALVAAALMPRRGSED